MVQYKPFAERTSDTQYRELLRRTIETGVQSFTQMDEDAIRLVGPQLHFDLTNGFPLITERDLLAPSPTGGPSQFEMGIAELCAFLNGARTLEEMRRFGCGWWAPWVTEEKCRKRGLEPGDLGPGSYGPAFRAFPTADPDIIAEIKATTEYGSARPADAVASFAKIKGLVEQIKPFDQITHLVEQIRELPHLRTHIVTPFIPQYLGRGKGKQQKVVVVPCHGQLHVFTDYPARGEMTIHHMQRSADVPVGLVFNLTQYAALLMMLAQVTGYVARLLVFTISDAHIYVGANDQRSVVEELLTTKPERLPTVKLDPDVTDIFTFRPHHFRVTDYHPQLERRRIKTPV